MKKWSLTYLRSCLNDNSIGAVLARGTASSLLVKIGGAAAAFVVQVLLARLLGATHFGEYVYALAWLNIMVLFAKTGFDTSLVRYVPQYSVQRQWPLLKGLIIKANQTVLLSSLLVCSICGFLIWFFKNSFSADQTTALWAAILCLPFLALNGLRQSALRGYKSIFFAEFPDRVFRPIIVAVVLGILYISWGCRLSAGLAMLINGAAIVLALVLGSYWLRKVTPRQASSVAPVFDTRSWLRTSIPLFLIAGMHIVLKRTDIIMLGSLASPEITGIYAAAVRVSDLVVFALASVNSIAAPMISELFHEDRKHELQALVTLAARGIFLFAMTVTLLLIVGGKHVLGIFGYDFVSGYIPLIILLFGQMVNAFVGSVGFLMTMTGNQMQASVIVGASAVLNICLNVILIPRYGMIGAAVATTVAMASWNLAMYLFVCRKLGINPCIFGILKQQ